MTAVCTLLAAILLGQASRSENSQTWPQWGGPHRDFSVAAAGLSDRWPEGGPKALWRRPLGDGFSGIVADGARVYTLYRDGASDVAVALDAADGKTVWEARYPAPFTETCSERLGSAPRAAPLLAGDRLIAVTAGGAMVAIDRTTGALQWRVELAPASGGTPKPCGYSSSPVQHKDTVITTAGGPGRGVIAIETATGRVRWAAHDFQNGYSSPALVTLEGRPHLIVFTAGEVSGLDPDTGALEWSQPHPADFGVNVALPLLGADNVLFVSSAYNGGSRALKLSRRDGKVVADELWATKRVRIHFTNAVRIGERIYASNGDFGAAPLAAVDIKTGEMLWRDRTVARASLIAAGDRLVILDEDGHLVLARPTAEGLTILGKTQVFSTRAWTAPTLVGTRLYLRDQKEIVALNLGS